MNKKSRIRSIIVIYLNFQPALLGTCDVNLQVPTDLKVRSGSLNFSFFRRSGGWVQTATANYWIIPLNFTIDTI